MKFRPITIEDLDNPNLLLNKRIRNSNGTYGTITEVKTTKDWPLQHDDCFIRWDNGKESNPFLIWLTSERLKINFEIEY